VGTLEDVLQLWLSKPEFREKFKKNPKEALEEEEIELNEEDFQTIQSYIKQKEEADSASGSNEELGKRISK
jgi:hypothetical protein